MTADPVALPALVVSWSDIDAVVTELAASIIEDGAPEVIVGVARGGLVPAVMFAHQLEVPEVCAIEVPRLHTDGVHAHIAAFTDAKRRSLGDLTGRDVLIVDDVTGSGITLATAAELVTAAGAARVRTAACVVDQNTWTRSNTSPPEAVVPYIGLACQGRARFPWEAV